MANLKDVVGTILREMVLAQHQTNLYSQSLSESYESSGRTSNFSLPAVSVGEIEMDFNYAIRGGLQKVEQEEINYSETNKILQYISREASNLFTKLLVQGIQLSSINYVEGGFAFVDKLNTNHTFKSALAKRIFSLLTVDVDRIMKADKFDLDAIHSILISIADEHVLTNSDIKKLFSLPGGDRLRSSIYSDIQDALRNELDDILRESQEKDFRRLQEMETLDIVINSEELASMPANAIHNFKIVIKPQVLSKE